MDDTDLVRPPRHERERVSRPASRSIPTVPVQSAWERCCAACGAAIVVRIDDEIPEFLREMWERQLASDAPARCDACQDAEERQRDAEQLDAQRAERAAHRRATSGIPPKWRGQRFDGLQTDQARRTALVRAAEWSVGEIDGLLLWGAVGCGKTAIAAAAANRRVEHAAVRWLSVAQLLLDLKMGFDTPEYTRAVRKLQATHSDAALVLDDLDKLKPTEHAVQPLYVAINAWIEAELPLLVTLNRDLDGLEDWMPDTFGAAIASRLAGYCATVHVGGHDRRLRAQEITHA
ncbi:MAG: ATP-binding protein [Actinomycetota bacterium]|nr:ATP-binding protein [Actinomycetota bacterium]